MAVVDRLAATVKSYAHDTIQPVVRSVICVYAGSAPDSLVRCDASSCNSIHVNVALGITRAVLHIE